MSWKKERVEMKVIERFTENPNSIVINFFFFEELVDKFFNNKISIK